MSLRAFHLFFIALSRVLAAFCAAWAVAQYRVEPSIRLRGGRGRLVAVRGALAVYGDDVPAEDEEAVAVTRPKHVLRLAATLALVAAPRAALACPVCFGQSDSPLAKGVNMGVLFLLGTIIAVLVAFASFIIYLARRAKLFAGDNIDSV